MKTYILLRDLPGVKAGTKFEPGETGRHYYFKKIESEEDEIVFKTNIIESNPDWFEEVQEKEFTKDDVIGFHSFCVNYNGLYEVTYEGLFREWLSQRKEETAEQISLRTEITEGFLKEWVEYVKARPNDNISKLYEQFLKTRKP